MSCQAFGGLSSTFVASIAGSWCSLSFSGSTLGAYSSNSFCFFVEVLRSLKVGLAVQFGHWYLTVAVSGCVRPGMFQRGCEHMKT